MKIFDEDTCEFIRLGIILSITGAVLVCAISTPIAWFDGNAKSAYLKQTQGVDIPWYQATWLDVTVNNVNAKVKNE